jgi:hypothetical protein
MILMLLCGQRLFELRCAQIRIGGFCGKLLKFSSSSGCGVSGKAGRFSPVCVDALAPGWIAGQRMKSWVDCLTNQALSDIAHGVGRCGAC